MCDCFMCPTIWLLKVMILVSAVLGVYSSILIYVHIYILCHFSFSFYTTHTGHLCLEHIELIVAYEYLHPYTAQVNLTVFIFSCIFVFFRSLLEMCAHINCLFFHMSYILSSSHFFYLPQPPASPLAGFYRALLRLSQHNWDVTPLIVDLSAEGKELQNPAIQAEIVNKFNALRSSSTEVNFNMFCFVFYFI